MAGAGTISGNVTNAGTISPTTTGTGVLLVQGNYIQSPSGAITEAIAGTNVQTGFCVFKVTGSATLAGALQVQLTNGYLPIAGGNFAFLSANSVSGQFSSVTNVNPINGFAFNASYSAASATIVVSSVGFVDLVVSQGQAPNQIVAGSQGAATWTVTNQGNTTTSALWHDAVFLSPDGQLDGGDVQLALHTEGSSALGLGGSYQGSTTFTVPVNVVPGNYYLVIDYGFRPRTS